MLLKRKNDPSKETIKLISTGLFKEGFKSNINCVADINSVLQSLEDELGNGISIYDMLGIYVVMLPFQYHVLNNKDKYFSLTDSFTKVFDAIVFGSAYIPAYCINCCKENMVYNSSSKAHRLRKIAINSCWRIFACDEELLRNAFAERYALYSDLFERSRSADNLMALYKTLVIFDSTHPAYEVFDKVPPNISIREDINISNIVTKYATILITNPAFQDCIEKYKHQLQPIELYSMFENKNYF